MSKESKKEKKIELKPCPFCSSEAYVGIEGFASYWSIGCSNSNCFCDFERRFETKEIAIEKWNKRNNNEENK